MKINKNQIIVILIAVIVVLSIILIKHYQLPDSEIVKYGSMEKRERVSGETLSFRLNSIGILDTAEYYYSRKESYYSDRTINQFPIPFTESGYTIGYEGRVTAGIDFSKVYVSKSNNTIHISVPKATIHMSEIDEDSFRLYEEKRNIFNPFSVRDFNTSYTDIKKKEEENAVKGGILEKANSNAEKYIENLLRNSYSLEDYQFEFSTVSEIQSTGDKDAEYSPLPTYKP